MSEAKELDKTLAPSQIWSSKLPPPRGGRGGVGVLALKACLMLEVGG